MAGRAVMRIVHMIYYEIDKNIGARKCFSDEVPDNWTVDDGDISQSGTLAQASIWLTIVHNVLYSLPHMIIYYCVAMAFLRHTLQTRF